MYRQTLGKFFTEGCRLLWEEVLASDSKEVLGLQRQLGMSHPGQLHRIIYGDRKPGLPFMLLVKEKLGHEVEVWNMGPTKAFHLPAADRDSATLPTAAAPKPTGTG